MTFDEWWGTVGPTDSPEETESVTRDAWEAAYLAGRADGMRAAIEHMDRVVQETVATVAEVSNTTVEG